MMTKQQLYQLATDPTAPMDDRYAAARELQRRRLKGEQITALVRLWPRLTAAEIAEQLNVPVQTVIGAAKSYGLLGRG
jgi:hypothetical protein